MKVKPSTRWTTPRYISEQHAAALPLQQLSDICLVRQTTMKTTVRGNQQPLGYRALLDVGPLQRLGERDDECIPPTSQIGASGPSI